MVAMMGGSGTLGPLSKLIDFLTDPEESKRVLDGHIKAANDHKNAANDHAQAEADAKAALLALESKENELNSHENQLTLWSKELQAQSLDLRNKKAELEDQAKVFLRNKEESIEILKLHVDEARDIVDKAKAEAEKILADQKVIVKKILDEALEKDTIAEQSKKAWSGMVDDANKQLENVRGREELLAKREQAVTGLASLLKGS